MNFQVLEADQFSKLEDMFSTAMQTVKELSSENFILKNRYLSAEDAALITGYSAQTIKLRKDEIGYITLGKDLKFKLEDVNNWMAKYYIKPRKTA